MNEPKWEKAEKFLNLSLPIKQWLLEPGSLTQRLKAHCQRFEVKVLKEEWANPWLTEARLLALNNEVSFIREVTLMGDGLPWVHGRTVIPKNTFNNYQHYFANIGNRPLGEIIFYELKMQRSVIEIAEVNSELSFPYERFQQASDQRLFARRSIFYLNQDNLLISEFFTPQFFEAMHL